MGLGRKPAESSIAAGYVAEENARSRANVAGAVTDRGLVLPPKLSGAGQWQQAIFSLGEGLAVALVCAACGAVGGRLRCGVL